MNVSNVICVHTKEEAYIYIMSAHFYYSIILQLLDVLVFVLSLSVFVYTLLPYKVEHHPKMIRYVAENFSLREENRQLRSLESLVKAEEVVAQVSAELEEAFQRAVESEGLTGGKMMKHTTEEEKL